MYSVGFDDSSYHVERRGNHRSIDDIQLGPRDEKSQTTKFEKKFYKEHDKTKQLTEQEVNEFRLKHDIKVFGKNVPKPVLSFEATNFPKYILDVIKKDGFKAPTPIQSQAWPIVLSGHDIIGLAETGSGKTLGFLLPALVHLKAQPPLKQGDGPIVLVLAPTRELAMQINNEAQRFCLPVNVKTCCVYGGSSRKSQQDQLRAGVDIVIATPGRLLDLLATRSTNLNRITYLVLDEADRMLDMGFEPQIRKVIEQTRPDRQTLMWSATWNKQVQKLASEFLLDPIIVNIGSVSTAANHRVVQKFMFIQEYDKLSKLVELVDLLMDGRKILIFCGTKRGADQICSKLRNSGWPALCIHGDKTQAERDWVMSEFRSGESPIMVATDVAARGLDIDDIKLVINFDMPNDIETYVHRIGRTARAGHTGASMTFFTPNDLYMSSKVKEILVEANQEVPEQINKMVALASGRDNYDRSNRYGGRGYGRYGGGRYSGSKRSYSGNVQNTHKKFKSE